MNKLLTIFFASLMASKAVIVTFTGGTITSFDSASGEETILSTTTDQQTQFTNVRRYQEESAILEYSSPTNDYSWQTIGDYYSQGNDVIHGHWQAISAIEISRENNIAFDLKYFQLTSNTSVGGGPATGYENITIQGFLNGVAATDTFRLPNDNWGADTLKDVFLPDSFGNVDKVFIIDSGPFDEDHTHENEFGEFDEDHSGFCFGMDNFVFDEVVPQDLIQGNSSPLVVVPEVSSVSLLALCSLFFLRKKR